MGHLKTRVRIRNDYRGTWTRNGPVLDTLTGEFKVKQANDCAKTLGQVGLVQQGAIGEYPLLQSANGTGGALYGVLRTGPYTTYPTARGRTGSPYRSGLRWCPKEVIAKALRDKDPGDEYPVLPRLLVPADVKRRLLATHGPMASRLGWDLEVLPEEHVEEPWVAPFVELVDLQFASARSKP